MNIRLNVSQQHALTTDTANCIPGSIKSMASRLREVISLPSVLVELYLEYRVWF